LSGIHRPAHPGQPEPPASWESGNYFKDRHHAEIHPTQRPWRTIQATQPKPWRIRASHPATGSTGQHRASLATATCCKPSSWTELVSGMTYPRRQKGDGIYQLVKSMSDADIEKGIRILMAEQEKRERATFKPIQPFGDFIHRHG
jgi:hypothetical protein